MLDPKRENDLSGFCRDLLRSPSLSGVEREMGLRVAEAMRSHGYDEVTVDAYGNVIGQIRFPKPGPSLLLEAQMDHVETGDFTRWSQYPYGAFIQGTRLYGRGASDQKGSLAAMVLAGAFLKEDLARRLSGSLTVAGTVFQEKFEGVASRAVALKCSPDFVVTGEASGLELVRGQRGRAELLLETSGKMAHSSHPEYGINAADSMVRLLAAIGREFRPSSDPFLGEGILVLVNLSTAPEESVGAVPDHCRAVFDRRLLAGETKEGVLYQLESILKREAGGDPSMKWKLSVAASEDRCYTGIPIRGEHFAPAWVLAEDHPFVQSARQGLEGAGLSPRVSRKPGFGTNGSFYGGQLRLPTVAFGPSSAGLAHVVDEYIELDQLYGARRGYYGIAASALGGPGIFQEVREP
jgi:putative selenium metabolism hydrolase